MDSTLSTIQSTEIEQYWPLIEDFIVDACKRNGGRYNEDDIKEDLQAARKQLWISINGSNIEAICITEIVKYPRKKYLNILIATGDNKDGWQYFIDEIENWAKSINCDGVESTCRKGWARIYKQKGYEMSHVFIEKEIG